MVPLSEVEALPVDLVRPVCCCAASVSPDRRAESAHSKMPGKPAAKQIKQT